MNRSANIYESLGVTPIINAAGTFTYLGGSLMSDAVIEAWRAAAEHYVDLQELQDAVGVRIAEMLDVEAALVTGGAAAGIMLSVAAAICDRDPDFVQRQTTVGMSRPYEVIRQQCHRDLYDRQIETCGVKIVEVVSEADLRDAISERTVMMHCCNYHEPEGEIDHRRWQELAREFSLPTLVDAAADVPPVENLNRLVRLGYDLVTFSGGKVIGGPQSSGLLLGKAKWIELAKRCAVPHEGTIGRVAKVSKEDIVALHRALELFLQNGDQLPARCQQQLTVIRDRLAELAGLHVEFVTPAVANHFPHLLLRWDEQAVGMTAASVARQLRDGSPRIATDRVYGTGRDGLLISAVNLKPGEERIVADRIAAIFSGPSAGRSTPSAAFAGMYQARPPWDIGRPQRAFIAAADTVVGSVLDVGCGTGENALFFAARGHTVTGIDFLEQPLQLARQKAAERGIAAEFVQLDVLELEQLGRTFDNVLDCGLFHGLSDQDRARYVAALQTTLRVGGQLVLQCFSDEEPAGDGPRRISTSELETAFATGWTIVSIQPTRFEVREDTDLSFSPGGPKAWFCRIEWQGR